MNKEQCIVAIKESIGTYIDINTRIPALKSVDVDINVATRLGESASILTFLEKNLIPVYDLNERLIDKGTKSLNNDLDKLSFEGGDCENDLKELGRIMSDTCTQKCLAPYINTQLNWILISILSSNYISAYILLRSTLEFLIKISSYSEGGMKARIESIPFFTKPEIHTAKKLWDNLCAWAHPHEKWTKNICQHFIVHTPLYHPKYFAECTSCFESSLDLYLIIAFYHFNLDIDKFIKNAHDKHINLMPFNHINTRIKERIAI